MVAASPSAAADVSRTGPAGPTRTCIGCRRQSPATALLRVVVTPDAADEDRRHDRTAVADGSVGSSASLVVPDARRRLPGRGAWLHPDLKCVSLAQRRRAFARALRVAVADPTPVLEHVTQQHSTDNINASPQEMTSNGHSMKRQR